MNINIYYEFENNRTISIIYKKLVEILIEENKNINFNVILTSNEFREKNNFSKFDFPFMVIENHDNKKYFLISFADNNLRDSINDPTWDNENCVELLTSSGMSEDINFYIPSKQKYTPISYPVSTMMVEEKIEDLYIANIEKSIPIKPFFRGLCFGFRNYVLQDNRFTVFNTFNNPLLRISPDEFLSELSRNHINLSLNGMGEISNRDIEIMGLGNVLLRTKLTINFHNELIPDYHYVGVDFLDINTDFIEDSHQKYEFYVKETIDRIYNKFEKIKKDKDFLNFISKNAREWYIENGKSEKISKIIFSLINLNKLK